MKKEVSWFLKGAAMGAANVIPGVSGGTVAFITGIYERLIEALRSINTASLRMLLRGRMGEFATAVDLRFLVVLGGGVVVSIFTLASVLKYLFSHHEVLVWAFFFGLILASVFFVGKKVGRWSVAPVAGFVFGTAVAVAVGLMRPGVENDSLWYLLFCGVVAMASMIIPGLSGSFVLLLLGNYQLIMIESVNGLRSLEPRAFAILIPVGLGAVLGLLLLSRLLSWVFRRYHDLAVALLTGFVAGSLIIIWPWKRALVEGFEVAGTVKEKVIGYEWYFPGSTLETGVAVLVMLAGLVAVWLMERGGQGRPESGEEPG